MLSHLNMASGQASVEMYGFLFREDDVYLSYVPLSHVFEQIMLADCLIYGFQIGYASGLNLIEDI